MDIYSKTNLFCSVLTIRYITGFFYYVLGNLSPKLRSSLKAIQLLAVAKCSVISKYGSNSILQSFMEDIRVLETILQS